MAVTNTLQQQKKNPMVITFSVGDEQVKLSPQIVKNYLVNGDADKVTEQEIVMFMNLCKFQHLNPFLREAYLIKYGTQPATIVTGKSALEKRACRRSDYEGFNAGVVVYTANGGLEYRSGSLVLQGEQLVGGWCDVYVKEYREPVKAVVSMDEYTGRKKDGSINSQWASKPATMIRKVAKMQALREAFPEDYQGMYSAEEVGAGELPEIPITAAVAQEQTAPASEPVSSEVITPPADFSDEL